MVLVLWLITVFLCFNSVTECLPDTKQMHIHLYIHSFIFYCLTPARGRGWSWNSLDKSAVHHRTDVETQTAIHTYSHTYRQFRITN